MKIPFRTNNAKTDEEYIELIRRRLKFSRTFSYLPLCIGILCIAVGIAIPLIIFKMLAIGADDPGRIWAEAQPGLWFGLLLGASGGVFMFLGVTQIGNFWGLRSGSRTEKLLLKYYDTRNEK